MHITCIASRYIYTQYMQKERARESERASERARERERERERERPAEAPLKSGGPGTGATMVAGTFSRIAPSGFAAVSCTKSIHACHAASLFVSRMHAGYTQDTRRMHAWSWTRLGDSKRINRTRESHTLAGGVAGTAHVRLQSTAATA